MYVVEDHLFKQSESINSHINTVLRQNHHMPMQILLIGDKNSVSDIHQKRIKYILALVRYKQWLVLVSHQLVDQLTGNGHETAIFLITNLG